jgi:hypothetical protein
MTASSRGSEGRFPTITGNKPTISESQVIQIASFSSIWTHNCTTNARSTASASQRTPLCRGFDNNKATITLRMVQVSPAAELILIYVDLLRDS